MSRIARSKTGHLKLFSPVTSKPHCFDMLRTIVGKMYTISHNTIILQCLLSRAHVNTCTYYACLLTPPRSSSSSIGRLELVPSREPLPDLCNLFFDNTIYGCLDFCTTT